MMTEPARKTSVMKETLVRGNCDYFAINYPILFAFYNVNEEPYNWISLSAVKVNTRRFTIVCSSVHQDGKCGSRCFAEDGTELFISACRTCSTIIFPHPTNQILNLWRCACRSCR